MGHEQRIEVIVDFSGEGWMTVRYEKETEFNCKETFLGMLLRSNSEKPEAPFFLRKEQVESWQAALKREQHFKEETAVAVEEPGKECSPLTENQLSASGFRLSTSLQESSGGQNSSSWKRNLMLQRSWNRPLRLRPSGSRVLCMKCKKQVESVTAGAVKRKMSINEQASEKRESAKKLKVMKVMKKPVMSTQQLKTVSVPLTRVVSVESSEKTDSPPVLHRESAAWNPKSVSVISGHGKVIYTKSLQGASFERERLIRGNQHCAKRYGQPQYTMISVSRPEPTNLAFAYTKSPVGASPRVTPVVSGLAATQRPLGSSATTKSSATVTGVSGEKVISNNPPRIIPKGPVVNNPVIRSFKERRFMKDELAGTQKELNSSQVKEEVTPKVVFPKMKITFGSDGRLTQITRERENGMIEKVPIKTEKKEKKKEKLQRETEEDVTDEESEVQSEEAGSPSQSRKEISPLLGPFIPGEADNPLGLKVGDVVWAKMSREPYWPSEIYSFSPAGETCVLWLGSKMHGWVQLSTLERFQQTFAKRYNKKRTTRGYQRAVCIAIEKLMLQRDSDKSWFDTHLSPSAWKILGDEKSTPKKRERARKGRRRSKSKEAPVMLEDCFKEDSPELCAPSIGTTETSPEGSSVSLLSAPNLSRMEDTGSDDDDDDDGDPRLVIDEEEGEILQSGLKELPEFSESQMEIMSPSGQGQSTTGDASPVKSEAYFEAALAGLQEINQLCSNPRPTPASC